MEQYEVGIIKFKKKKKRPKPQSTDIRYVSQLPKLVC